MLLRDMNLDEGTKHDTMTRPVAPCNKPTRTAQSAYSESVAAYKWSGLMEYFTNLANRFSPFVLDSRQTHTAAAAAARGGRRRQQLSYLPIVDTFCGSGDWRKLGSVLLKGRMVVSRAAWRRTRAATRAFSDVLTHLSLFGGGHRGREDLEPRPPNHVPFPFLRLVFSPSFCQMHTRKLIFVVFPNQTRRLYPVLNLVGGLLCRDRVRSRVLCAPFVRQSLASRRS